MAISRDYLTFIEDLLAPLGGVNARAMFGGAGIFRDGIMFGLIAGEALYLKADSRTAPAFAAEGMEQFVYSGKSKTVAMPYWQVPERLYEDAEELNDWAARAFDVALRGKTPARKPKASKRRQPA